MLDLKEVVGLFYIFGGLMVDKDYLELLARLERDHVASAYAIFCCSESANKFEMYCLRHNYATASYSMRTEDGEPLTKVVYWKKD